MTLLVDLDGTLVDSEPWHKRSEIETFAKWGINLEVADLMPFTGTTLPHMLAGIGERFRVAITPEEFMKAQIPTFRRYIAEHVDLFPDAARLVERLLRGSSAPAPRSDSDSPPFGHAIVTSAMPWYVDAVLARHPILNQAFRVIVDQGDVENSKPDPEPFRVAAGRLGVRPEECTAIEDSVNGVRSAKAAGCRAVGVDREGHGRLAEADKVVRTLDAIRESGTAS
jgi:beta-phosphoglucomutase-like phosphatase (HAD superfamily)